MMNETIELIIDYPSKIASMLVDNAIDVGLVPVAIIPELQEYHIVSDYCIGSEGEVASVCLFSEVSLEKIETILLDYQSRTSVELLKILVKKFWKIDPVFKDTSAEYRNEIAGTTAALVIGDRALEQRKISHYVYDLGAEWKKFTGLPFVFAAWVSNKKLSEDFVAEFNRANKYGLGQIGEVVSENAFPLFNLNEYYKNCISYDLNDDKRRGLKLFLREMLKETEVCESDYRNE